MTDIQREKVLMELAKALDIPDTAHEAAEFRYHDLGEWLRDDSKAKSAIYQPFVSPQGSFRLGTVTRPWKRDDYDLDVACSLQVGLTTAHVSQHQLKQLVGADLNAYRNERQIRERLEAKHRCWRLHYQDRLQFHIDTVPSIPHTEEVRNIIRQRMLDVGADARFAHDVAVRAVAITDDRHPSYERISNDWYISNPEGYARWFESRMKLAKELLKSRVLQAKVRRIEDLPVFRWKTPLQMAIQILKRHRDVMFETDTDRKPISIIITTLAAQAYGGESELLAALGGIMANMQLNQTSPRVPNPVNPQEDFADRWKTPDGRRLGLEENFEGWLLQVQKDVHLLLRSPDLGGYKDHIRRRFGVSLHDDVFRSYGEPTPSSFPNVHVIRHTPPKPWQQ